MAVIGLVSVAFLGAEAFVPLAVASARGAGTVAGGLALTAAAVTWATGSWLQARFAARGSRTWLLVSGAILIGVGIGIEAAIPITSLPIWVAAAAWAVAGLGMGLAYSTATLVVIETAESGTEGAAAIGAQLSNTLGVAIGTGLAGGIVAFGATGLGGLAPAITIANLVLVAVCGATVVIARRVPDRKPAPDRGSRPLPAEARRLAAALGPERLVVAGYHQVCHLQDPIAADLERRLVIGSGVDLRRSVGSPPGVGAGHHPVIGLGEDGQVLVRMTRGHDQPRVRAEPMAFALVVDPLVATVVGPGIDNVSFREERRVDRVVGVMMGQHDVGDLCRGVAQRGERPQDGVRLRHQPRVDHDQCAVVLDQADAAAHRGAGVANVAGVQQVESGWHGFESERSIPRTPTLHG